MKSKESPRKSPRLTEISTIDSEPKMAAGTITSPAEARRSDSHTTAGTWLILATSLMMILKGCLWITGFETQELNIAVEQGSATIERKAVGEVADSVIRDAIKVQRSSLRFWKTLRALADFVFDPISLVIRALAVATLFSSIAALTGRSIQFDSALRESSAIQMYWVAGLFLRVLLMIALRRTDVETSASLFLSPGRYHASTLVFLRQIDPFFLMGWLSLAIASWRRGQANLFVSLVLCSMLALTEITLRTACLLLIGGGMRLSILPDTLG